MALLGMKKKQAFGALPQQVSPLQAYGDGGMMPPTPPTQTMQQPAEPERFKPNILGVIGDAMQIFGGGQATYMNGVREQQERDQMMRQRAMQAQQERETGWQDWVKKQEYSRANPELANNDTANDLALYKSWTPEDRALYHQMKPIVQTMADGSQRLYDPTASAPKAVPQKGMIEDGHEFLGGDPKNPANWRKAGGAVSNGGNGFR